MVIAESSSSDYQWTTSNKNVATVSSNGTITGVSAGTAYIRATISGSKTYDELCVTVLPPMKVNFNLTYSESKTRLSWNKVPGATEYRVYAKGADESAFSELAATEQTYLTTDIASDGPHQVYVRSLRMSGDQIITSFTSDKIIVRTQTELKITSQPTSVTAAEGNTAKVTVKATGDGLTYAWYYKNAGASKFTRTYTFSGNTYTAEMTAARDGRQIYCVITDAYGNSVTSDVATLTMG